MRLAMRPIPPIAILIVILAIAASLRGFGLGWPSLWYDEVVSVRLARTPGAGALLKLLDQTDATRAPLHPFLLQGWFKLFGSSDLACRSLSALFGVVTVAVVAWIGREVYDAPSGLWAAWLCAVSPVLVRYSREVRMYSLLVLLTCLAWAILFSFRRSATIGKHGLFTIVLIALFFTHPLGAFMIVALGLAYLGNRSSLRLSIGYWLAIQGIVVIAMVPWLGRYTNHPPEYLIGKLSIKFLIGMPIEFIGGNSLALLAVIVLIASGLIRFEPRVDRERETWFFQRIRVDDRATSSALLIWFTVPPVLLYVSSSIFHPIFGPSRYTLFVAPAYLLLVGRGLARLPIGPRVAMAAAGAVLSAQMLGAMVYDPDLRADWRGATSIIAQHDDQPTVIVPWLKANPINFEAVTARYYLGPSALIIAGDDDLPRLVQGPALRRDIWIAKSVRAPEMPLPEFLDRRYVTTGTWRLPGMQLIRKSQ